jgi:hypothetical protein
VVATAAPVTPEIRRNGADLALSVLENALIAGSVSDRTQQFMHQQADQVQANPANPANPADQLNQLTALVLGSPEFQMR